MDVHERALARGLLVAVAVLVSLCFLVAAAVASALDLLPPRDLWTLFGIGVGLWGLGVGGGALAAARSRQRVVLVPW